MSGEVPVAAQRDACGRCGDPHSSHVDATGNELVPFRRWRFSAEGACNARHLSGGASGSLQWCGCTGYEPREVVD